MAERGRQNIGKSNKEEKNGKEKECVHMRTCAECVRGREREIDRQTERKREADGKKRGREERPGVERLVVLYTKRTIEQHSILHSIYFLQFLVFAVSCTT